MKNYFSKYFHSKSESHIMLYLMMIQLVISFVVNTDVLAKSGDSVHAKNLHFEFYLNSYSYK